MSEERRYLEHQFKKVQTLLDCADANMASQQDIKLQTNGYDPSCAIQIPAYILRQFISLPKVKE